jgi:hypothetical protein
MTASAYLAAASVPTLHMTGLVRTVVAVLLVSAWLAVAPAVSDRSAAAAGPWLTGYYVADLATDAAGHLYVLDTEQDRVTKLDRRGRRAASWRARGGSALTVSPTGEVYLLDLRDGRVRVLVDGRVVRNWAVPVDGSAWRGGIAVGPEGNVYVAGLGYRLGVFDIAGHPLGEWHVDQWRDHDRQVTGDPGVVQPIDVAVGPHGNVYVADSYLSVHVFTPAGTELGSWSKGKLANDDHITGISVGPSGLAMVSTIDGPVDRFTTDGGYLGSWGGPEAWRWEDAEWPGDFAEYGYMDSALDGPVGATTFAPDGTLYADTYAGIMRVPVEPTRVDPQRSTLDFAPDALRFIPAGDGDAALVANLLDDRGAPVTDEIAMLVARPSSGAVGSGGGRGQPCAAVRGTHTLECRISAPWGLGGWDVRLVDVATGTTLAGPVRLESTRKVVVLAQGFNSALKKRFCYWGPTRRTGRQDCEAIRDQVLAEPRGVYGKLVSLGFRADEGFGDPGATILDMSWDLVPCGDKECVAEIESKGGDVSWLPRPYDIGGPQLPESVERQLEIDRYAAALVETLKRYDQALAEPETGVGAHATFYLVGHSMGGELVVRTLNAAQADPYFIDQGHRGLVRTVISVDGALNWANTFIYVPGITAIPYPDFGTFASVPGKGTTHCGFVVYTKPSAAKEVENANAVQLAHRLMGTTTIALTNGDDWVVPYDPELVELPVALLESPVKPKPGYGRRLFWGYGKGKAGDPDCGHSTLLRAQPSGLYTSDKWDEEGVDPSEFRAKDEFPLGKLFEKYIGYAVWEDG